ncbi:MAG TPA: 2-succinyl-5-enolpyruvyl-6-hydroxy-3-cyclohexene-1-carboxylic-acid synthase [Solirubrobacteraceae bacterium]|nr:2-succinyl-5-enolpyruvyl-6-hydroxy-3-cyclohexene-1-carboxylic-acid synthase [Solirubrobacteraceae bacterium]
MSAAAKTDALLAAFVDELARCGLRHACTSPGSRCAPLVLALARDERLRCNSHIDERCAGFFALGLAKAFYAPVAIACTSGTAVAELLPAVVEAREARVPLIVLSADRPPELREVGAGQTIDQLGIFGGFAKWFFDIGVVDAESLSERWLRTLACRAYWTALDGRPGAVHLNFALREPLVSEQPPSEPLTGGRPDGRPLVTRRPTRCLHPEDQSSLQQALAGCSRGVVVAGRHERDTPLGEAAARFCSAAGWPLLADPLSRARRGEAAIAHYDALLRDARFAEAMRPDIVLRVGDLPTSKPLRSWLAAMPDVPQAAIDPESAWQDPAAALCRIFALEPAAALAAATPPDPDPDWLAAWRTADERASEAIRATIGGETLNEPLVAAELGVLLPEQATLFVASSMPVRDIETFWPVREDPPRVLCNRGANGIDGTVSSAFGAATAMAPAAPASGSDGEPVILLIGDVALAHDLGGLLAASRLGLRLTIVLVNNGGGGIFDFLPVAEAPLSLQQDRYSNHIATPTGLDFGTAAKLYGLAHETAGDTAAFRAALEQALGAPGSTLIEVGSERAANLATHRDVWQAVARALRS